MKVLEKKNLDRLWADMKDQFKGWKKFHWALAALLIASLTAATIFVAMTNKGILIGVDETIPVSTVDLIMGYLGSVIIFLYLIMVGQGKKPGYIYGAIGCVLWGYVAISSQVWFQVILQFGVFLPIVLLGFYDWVKPNQDESGYSSKELSRTHLLMIVLGLFAVAAGLMWIVALIPGEGMAYYTGEVSQDMLAVFLDTILTLLAATSTFLMVKGYNRAWSLWVIANTFGIILYGYFVFRMGNWAMFGGMIGWSIYTINSVHVWYNAVYLPEYSNKSKIENNKKEDITKSKTNPSKR